MYRVTLLLSFLILLFGSEQANAAATNNAEPEYTADALAARAIVKEAMAGFRPIVDALNDPKNVSVDQLKATMEQTLKELNSHFVPLQLVEAELKDDEKTIYKKADFIKHECEISLTTMLSILFGDVQAGISHDAEAQLNLITTKANEMVEKLTALHDELKQLEKTRVEGTCLQSSDQVRIYRLHHDALIAAEVLVLLSAEFSLTAINKNNDQRIESFIGTMESGFMDRITSTSTAIGGTIAALGRKVATCKNKSKSEVGGVTYATLSPIFTYYITATYGVYRSDDVTLPYDEDKFWFMDKCLPAQKERRCKGPILGCSQQSLPPTDICLTSPDVFSEYQTRYAYMHRGTGPDSQWFPEIARNSDCATDEVSLQNNIGSSNAYCHYLQCTCEDPADDVVRHFSLKEALSDDNKVVTGVRFKREGYTINLQIQQGTILKNGAIDQSSVQWKKVDVVDPLDFKTEEYRDFMAIKSGQRTICMEHLDAMKTSPTRLGHVLTGVRFTVQSDDLKEKFLQFEIRLTPYDLVTGQLNHKESSWLHGEEKKSHDANGRKLVGPIDNINYVNQNCVSFTRTLVDDILVGQTVVPLISLREVAPYPAVPLTGVKFDLASIKRQFTLPKGGILHFDQVSTFDISNYYSKKPAQS